MSETMKFRKAVPGDEGLILTFIRELADYEGMLDQVVADEATLHTWIFEKGKAEVLFVLEGETEVGFALFFHNFKDNPIVERIFKGIRPAVVALIAAPTFTMGRSAKINRYNLWIPVVSALLIWLLGFSPIWIIIAAGVGGFLWGKVKEVES